MQKHLDIHWKAVKRILRYLKGLPDEGIIQRRSETLALTRFSESDWVNEPDDRRSAISFCIYWEEIM